jgi:hypothetical protein
MADYKVWDHEFTYYGMIEAKTDEEAIRESKIFFQLRAPIVQNMTKRAVWEEL